MDQSEKQTKNRVVDVSWAADYLDDTWENEHAAKGAYDTQVLPPLKKYMQSDSSKVNPLSSTQEFKSVDDSSGQENEEDLDDLHIVDAVTDETIASRDEALKVRDKVQSALQDQQPELQDDDEDDLKIRDAVTDQTVASVEDVREVRRAAVFFDLKADLEEREKIRDALSAGPKMPSFLEQKNRQERTDTGLSSEGITKSEIPVEPVPVNPKKEQLKSPRGLETLKALVASKHTGSKPDDKTIVASKEVANVRKAAETQVNLENLFRDDSFDLEPDDDGVYDEYLDVDDDYGQDYDGYPEQETFDEYPEYSASEDYGEYPPDQGEFDEYREFDEPDDYDEYPDQDLYDDYRDYEEPRKRSGKSSRQRYYYGYKPSRNPLRFIPLVLVVAICVLGFIAALQICHDVPLNASDYSKVKYTVESGLTNEQLSRDLEALGIIDNPLVFKLRCLFYSADYVPGTYELSPCYSTEKIINILSGYIYGTD